MEIHSDTQRAKKPTTSAALSSDIQQLSSTTPISPLVIPELLFLVGSWLHRGTLPSALQVNKFWYQVLVPCLYSTISPQDRLSTHGLERHATLIRCLALRVESPQEKPTDEDEFDQEDEEEEDPEQIANKEKRARVESFRARIQDFVSLETVQCVNLRELTLVFVDDEADADYWHGFGLIKRNPGLQSLHITAFEALDYRPCWGPILVQCQHRLLRVLSLCYLSLSEQDTVELVRLAQSLVQLDLQCQATWSGSVSKPYFPRMERLSIGSKVFDQRDKEMTWIQACPSLKSLRWHLHYEGENYINLMDTMIRNTMTNSTLIPCWAGLQDLALDVGYSLYDRQIAMLLEICGPLRVLKIRQAQLWYRTLAALERHFPTLEELHLIQCLKSWMGHWILARASKLVHFTCSILSARDLIDIPAVATPRVIHIQLDAYLDERRLQSDTTTGGEDDPDGLRALFSKFGSVRNLLHKQSWVCLGLKSLQSYVECPKMSSEAEQDDCNALVFQKISALTCLQTLNVSKPSDIDVSFGYVSLEFSLCAGLYRLAPLTGLRALWFDWTGQAMHENDVLWILANFRDLKAISCELHHDRAERRKLTEVVIRESKIIPTWYTTTLEYKGRSENL
ncbi:hypothetical protein BGZ83_006688 [Gryganskiella cystojenkinii]|nr:hypothetical protein BGZ83_006688 [Gryganskiella cystojenkinii]